MTGVMMAATTAMISDSGGSVLFDSASYFSGDVEIEPAQAVAQFRINASGNVERRGASGGGFTDIGNWIKGGGAPVDPTLYEVRLDTLGGLLTDGTADVWSNVPASGGAAIYGVREDGLSTNLFVGTIRVRLIAGGAEEDTAGVSLSATQTEP